ncbi:MAG: M56 family metallopeptidase [Holophagales bacterium]|nr:M56 family metallopeptidase [Holophagales bacterium]
MILWLSKLALLSSFVLLSAALADRFLHRASAARRHLIWSTALGALLLLPSVSLFLPLLPMPGIELAWLPSEPPMDPSATAAEGRTDPQNRSELAREAGGRGAAREGAPGTAAPGSTKGTGAFDPLGDLGWLTRRLIGSEGLSVTAALLGLAWLTGATAALFPTVVGLVGLGLIGLRASPFDRIALETKVWRRDLDAISRALDIQGPIRLVAQHAVTVPMTWGLVVPTILLPAEARSWGESQRRAVLAHELAHVARHDWATQMLGRLAAAVFWFHPLAWRALSRLEEEAEKAADDRALSVNAARTAGASDGGSPADYADLLLGLARRRSERLGTAYSAGLAMARGHELSQRIDSILDPRRKRQPVRRYQVVLAALTMLLTVGLLGSTRIVSAQPDRLQQDRPRPDRSQPDLPRPDRPPNPGDLPREGWQTGAEATHEAGTASGADRRRWPTSQERALVRDAGRGNLEAVRTLLDQGTDPNASVASTGNALIQAVRGGHGEVVELLLERGARADAGVPGDGNALIRAAAKGDAGLLRRLLATGADPDAAVIGDGSPLIAAARRGEVGLIHMLLEAGADVDQVVAGDENALIQAAWNGHLEATELLLRRGADPHIVVLEQRRGGSVEKRTALAMARTNGHSEVVELLKRYGARF